MRSKIKVYNAWCKAHSAERMAERQAQGARRKEQGLLHSVLEN